MIRAAVSRPAVVWAAAAGAVCAVVSSECSSVAEVELAQFDTAQIDRSRVTGSEAGSDGADHPPAVGDQGAGEVDAVLSRNPGDQRCPHAAQCRDCHGAPLRAVVARRQGPQ